MSDKSAPLRSIEDLYTNDPRVRALVDAVKVIMPFVGPLDTLILSRSEQLSARRRKLFLEGLAASGRPLTNEDLERDDTLSAFINTYKAAINTRRHEKIRCFAHLLAYAVEQGLAGTDEYDEFLQILDDVSMRELSILMILRRFEDTHPAQLVKAEGEGGEPQNDLQRANGYWADFEAAVSKGCGVDPDLLPGMLTRLNRTGLYETIVGAYLDYTGNRGKLTALGRRFVTWLRERTRDTDRT